MTRSARSRAFTLIEVMVAVAIIVVLATALLFGTRAARNAMRRSTAEQQMALIRNAINEYARSWPRWEVPSVGVVIAEQGWPDFCPSRLFCTSPLVATDAYSTTYGFNDLTDAGLIYDITGGIVSTPDGDIVEEGDVEYAAETLLYCLTAEVGKGPFLTDKMGENLQTAHVDELYPGFPPSGGMGSGGAARKARGELIDPWGTPYRYFWVYRDANPNQSQRAYKGFLPVRYAAFHANPALAQGHVANNSFRDPVTGQVMTAVGYVLESAGPDRKFGNVWKVNPTPQEIQDAEDNLIVMP